MTTAYEFLTVETVPDYIRATPALADRVDPDQLLWVREIGDGNLNLVFLARDTSGRGLVLKQALPYVRMTGEGWPMTPERARFEVDSLRAHHALLPEHVVEVFDYNPERHIIAMEDLSDHWVWRGALNEGLTHDGAAAAIGRYVGAVAFGTSALGMERAALAQALQASVNPELCLITEDLVFTEPSVDAGRNSTLEANRRDAEELAADEEFVTAMGRAKWLFMTKAEALIHGDLHTGSVMVRAASDGRPRSTKVFDSEFAFYGPVGFDLGLSYANYVIAAARAFALGEDERAAWALGLLDETWQAFDMTFRALWPRRLDPSVFTEATLADFIAKVAVDGLGFGAAEAMRRIVGLAKTADIETLPPELREGAARGVLRASRMMATTRHRDPSAAAAAARAGDILLATRTR